MIDARVRRRNVSLLAVGQVSAWAVTFLHVFLGPFAIREMTGTFALSGLPVAMWFLSSVLVVVPAGRFMDRVGRAPVLAFGFVSGASGATLVATSLTLRAQGLAFAAIGFLAGLFLLAAGLSIALLARVAVADLYLPQDRAHGLGRFILLSFVGCVIGAAALLTLTQRGPAPVASGYLAMVPLYGLGIVAMAALWKALPVPSAGSTASRRALRGILRRSSIRWTITSNAGANAGMAGVMSLASPALTALGGPAMIAMMLGHYGGMFLPSPLAGCVADRRGRALAILSGGVILAVGAVVFTRTDLALLATIGLFCVGAGWCLTFIAGTALLADSTSLEERGSLFGTNDAIVAILSGTVVILAGIAFSMWGVLGLAALGVLCGMLSVAAGAILRRGARGQARPIFSQDYKTPRSSLNT